MPPASTALPTLPLLPLPAPTSVVTVRLPRPAPTILTLACQPRPGENWTFFEIDPQVARMATDPARFSFMSHCAPGARIVLGDARLTLSDAAPDSLDLIVVDAFSSDAIPIHLMTTEAIGLKLSLKWIKCTRETS